MLHQSQSDLEVVGFWSWKYLSAIALEDLEINEVFQRISVESFWILYQTRKNSIWTAFVITNDLSFILFRWLVKQNRRQDQRITSPHDFVSHQVGCCYLIPRDSIILFIWSFLERHLFLEASRCLLHLISYHWLMYLSLLYIHRSSLFHLNWIIPSWAITRNSMIWNNNLSKTFDITRRYIHYNYSNWIIEIYQLFVHPIMTHTQRTVWV